MSGVGPGQVPEAPQPQGNLEHGQNQEPHPRHKSIPKKTQRTSPVPPEVTHAQTHHEAMQALAGAGGTSSETPVDSAIARLRPTMSEDDRESTQRLYGIFTRVFDAVGYRPDHVDTLIELGIETAPHLPAVQAAFSPDHYIGIDINAEGLKKAQADYPSLPTEGQGSLSLINADAINLSIIPGLQPESVDAVVTFHPDIAADKDEVAEDDSFTANPDALTALDNWRQQLSLKGIMVITTYYPEEAEAIVSNPELSPYVRLYGITGILQEGKTHGYVVVLMATPREEGKGPTVWTDTDRQYHGYDSSMYLSQNRNMFEPDDE